MPAGVVEYISLILKENTHDVNDQKEICRLVQELVLLSQGYRRPDPSQLPEVQENKTHSKPLG